MTRFSFALALTCLISVTCLAQDTVNPKPPELDALKASVGVWDAEIRVWPQGPDAPVVEFKGVETIRAYGEFWIASDFDSEFAGQTMKVHSIVGYDLTKKQLVGTVIDDGPYAASMTGKYDEGANTIHWRTDAKDPSGKAMVQRTSVIHKSADSRVLVLSVPGEPKDELIKFMEITFTRRK